MQGAFSLDVLFRNYPCAKCQRLIHIDWKTAKVVKPPDMAAAQKLNTLGNAGNHWNHMDLICTSGHTEEETKLLLKKKKKIRLKLMMNLRPSIAHIARPGYYNCQGLR